MPKFQFSLYLPVFLLLYLPSSLCLSLFPFFSASLRLSLSLFVFSASPKTVVICSFCAIYFCRFNKQSQLPQSATPPSCAPRPARMVPHTLLTLSLSSFISLSPSLSLNATCIICIAKWAKSRQNKADCCGPPFLSLPLFGYPFRLNNVAELCVRFIT